MKPAISLRSMFLRQTEHGLAAPTSPGRAPRHGTGHSLMMAHDAPFTQSDLDWFRKPVAS